MKNPSVAMLRCLAVAAFLITLAGLPATLQGQSVSVRLGEFGGTATLFRTSSGGYTWNGQAVADGSIITGTNGLRYRLTVSGNQPAAAFLPRLARVELGASGVSVTLTQQETGDYWLGGVVVRGGDTVTLSDGSAYRLSLAGNVWSSTPVSDTLTVALGQSGRSIRLVPAAGGGYSYLGTRVREGRIITDSTGRRYQFTFRNGTWRANPVSTVPGRPSPPADPDGPDPSPVLISDIRDTYVGVQPVLVTGEDGIRRSVLRVGGQEYSVETLFRDGGVTSNQTFAERTSSRLETIRDQMELLEDVLGDDSSQLSSSMSLRWRAAQTALNEFFGTSGARNILGTLPRRSNGRVNVSQAVGILDEVLQALSNFSEFHFAVRSGILANAVDLDETDEAFDAIHSVSEMRFGTTFNTRFGVYARQERDGLGRWTDDLELVSGTNGFGTFAYSPLDASERADLPSYGEAQYSGRTVAIATADPSVSYSGTFEVSVRFNANRVGAIVRDLETDDGRPWRYAFANVTSIVLPNATLNRSDASFSASGSSVYASVNYPAVAGAPAQQRVRSEIKGQMLGEGVDAGTAAIGTWSLKESSSRTLIAGAFGVEYEGEASVSRPTINDSGLGSRTYIQARPDADGNIAVGGTDASGRAFSFEVADLFASGFADIQGDALMSVAQRSLERQVELLDLWTSLDLTASQLNSRRRSIWSSANTTLYETVFGRNYRARNLLGSSYPTGTSRDRVARERLVEAAEAVGDEGLFAAALDRDGLFADVSPAVSDSDSMFDVLEHYVRVDYNSTNYGRFGVWAKRSATGALNRTTITSGGFAYSPVAQTTYYSGDPAYPSGGTAFYVGSTVAVESSGNTRPFEGRMDVTVRWGTRVSSATLTATVRNLRTVFDDRPLAYNGYAVDAIVFQGVRLTGSTVTGTGFNSRSPDVRVRYADAGRADTRWSGSRAIEGKFVGETLDGPLGVIGTWSLTSTRSSDLDGAFAADLAP